MLAGLFSLVSSGSYFHHHGALPIEGASAIHSLVNPNDDGPERCAVCGASHTNVRLQDRSETPEAGDAIVLTGRGSERSPASTLPRSPGSPRSPPSVLRAA